MRKLVVNADDGGLDPKTDEAILRAAEAGVVRCATVVAAGPTAPAFLGAARDAGLEVGLHINLTQGRALAGPAPTLTGDDGTFHAPKGKVWMRALAGGLDEDEVRREVRAQWTWVTEHGVEPTHLNGHNHVHLFPVVRRVLKEYPDHLWVRVPIDCACDHSCRPDLPDIFNTWAAEMERSWRRTDRFTGYAFSLDPSHETFLGSLPGEGEWTEFMVHPGAREGSPFESSELRDREAEILCSPRLRDAAEQRGFEFVNFSGK